MTFHKLYARWFLYYITHNQNIYMKKVLSLIWRCRKKKKKKNNNNNNWCGWTTTTTKSTWISGWIQHKDIQSRRSVQKGFFNSNPRSDTRQSYSVKEEDWETKNKIKFQRKSQIGYNKKIFSQGGVLGIMPKYLFWKILYLNIF